MEKMQTLFKSNGELLDVPLTFTYVSSTPYMYQNKPQPGKMNVVLRRDGKEYSWDGVEEKKFTSTAKDGHVLWAAKIGDEIDITLKPNSKPGMNSWWLVSAKGYVAKSSSTSTINNAKDVFTEHKPLYTEQTKSSYSDKKGNRIGVQGIFQVLLQLHGSNGVSDDDVLTLIDRSIEIMEMIDSKCA